MSGSGRARALLEAQRKEELRKEQVRKDCIQIVISIQKKAEEVSTDAVLLDMSKHSLSNIISTIKALEQQIQSQPDQTYTQLQSQQQVLVQTLVKAQSQAKNWQKEQEEAINCITNMELALSAMQSSNDTIVKKQIPKLVNILDQTKLKSSSLKIVKEKYQEFDEETKKIRKESEDEEVRKELVRNIISALKKAEFQIATPKLQDNIVVLKGVLPSGKGVVFQIHQNATFDFDFDGFTGTSCKEKLDEIISLLEKETQVKSEIQQFVWHNPDRIKKGSKEFPGGGNQKMVQSKG